MDDDKQTSRTVIPPEPRTPPRMGSRSSDRTPKTRRKDETNKAIELLNSLHPSVLMTIMTLIGALGGSSIVVALGGATGEQVDELREEIESNEDRIIKMEYDLQRARLAAEAAESMKTDLGIVKNDMKHMNAKITEISLVLQRGGN